MKIRRKFNLNRFIDLDESIEIEVEANWPRECIAQIQEAFNEYIQAIQTKKVE